jgi:hypothetical protein
MWNGLEKRLARIEKRLAERKWGPSFCNCRIRTRFHNAECRRTNHRSEFGVTRRTDRDSVFFPPPHFDCMTELSAEKARKGS